ncbi:MAG: hypothetical protein IJL57_04830 [Bacteroidales bacterium]|nr:hypothetical protein [Bacteroidales bacterium]
MKEVKTISLILVCCAVMLGSFSCRHEAESVIDNGNRVIPVQTGEKTANECMFMVSLGHDAKGCPGCILFHGKYVHVDCQGNGTACRVATAVSLNQVATAVTATTTDTFGLTSENFFLMPARSLNYTDEHNNRIFLNIPGQLLFRDSITQQFTFTGLSFTSSPLY